MSFCSLSLIHFLKDIIAAVTDELFQRLVIRVGTEGRIHQGPDIAVEFDDAVQPTGVGGVDADPGVIGTLGNPFIGCRKVEFNATMNYNAHYTDMMLYTAA